MRKILIINNTASQGYILQKKLKGSDLIVSKKNIVCFYGYNFMLFPKSRIGKVLWLLFNLKKYNEIILNAPGSNFDYLICLISKFYKAKVFLYMHGSETRKLNAWTKKCIKLSDEIWYSTKDLTKYLPKQSKHKPAKPIKYSNKRKILVFSRNDEFKKTHLHFKEARKNKNYEYYFIDWFKDDYYKKAFVKLMPKNCHLIPIIKKEHVYFVLNGFDKVIGQLSGEKGVSEKEIEKYIN